MEQLSAVFKALSEPLRLRIIRQLLASKEAYGEELATALGIPAYQLSRHLKILKSSGLIHERKAGRWVHYSLANADGHGRLLAAIRRLLAEAQQPVAPSARPSRMSRAARPATTDPGPARRPAGEPALVDWEEGAVIPGLP